MLNKVLVFLSEIIYNAWHKVISDLATPPPPPGPAPAQSWAAGTHTDSYFRRSVFATSVLSPQSLKKKKYPKIAWDLESLFM